MKAFMVEKYGDQAGMRAAETPDPQVGADDVLVKIHAAGVNPLEPQDPQRRLQSVPALPSPARSGQRPRRDGRPGRPVRHPLRGGRRGLRPARQGPHRYLRRTHRRPPGRPGAQTGRPHHGRGRLQPGQKILVHAGAGGLGSIAVQLAKALGAHVATTVSTAKVDLARDLGADVVVDYRTQDFEEVLDGYDVVLDSLGGENLAKSLRVLKPGGTVISVAAEEPDLVRKLILAGTGPAGGPGINKVTSLTIKDTVKALLTRKDPKQYLFFADTAGGRRAAHAFLDRLKERTNDRDKAISLSSFRAQLKAIHHWGRQTPADLSRIHQPVLVANGESDRMVPSVNTVDLAARLPHGELEPLYPDAGHGGIFQHHDRFVPRALEFLEPLERQMPRLRHLCASRGGEPFVGVLADDEPNPFATDRQPEDTPWRSRRTSAFPQARDAVTGTLS